MLIHDGTLNRFIAYFFVVLKTSSSEFSRRQWRPSLFHGLQPICNYWIPQLRTCFVSLRCVFSRRLISGDLPLQKSKPLQLFYKVWMRTYWLIPSKFSKVGIWMGPVEGEDEKTIIHWYRLSSRLQAGPRLNYLWLLLWKISIQQKITDMLLFPM